MDGDREERNEAEGEDGAEQTWLCSQEKETVRRELSVSDRGERIDRCVWRREDS